MAEILQTDGTWVFDGDTIRIVPGRERGVHVLRQTLGELAVPLAAVAGLAFEPARRGGRLRLRLRGGADPLSQVTRGRLPESADPYQLTVDADRTGVAEYFVDEVRNALLLEQVPAGPTDRYLLPGPAVPISVGAGDGTASFDGERIRLEWNWKTEEGKKSSGTRLLPVTQVSGVEWQPAAGLENGYLRFTVPHAPTEAPPKHDPHAVELFGFKKDALMALVAAAVVARLPHPGAAPVAEPAPPGPLAALPAGRAPAAEAAHPAASAADDHDALLRRLRELGELHHSGVLTDEEFTAAKQAILKRF
ncbi:Tat pathway signal sequence domain protein [Streptomyces cinnamoneus]|uniref:Tat pathway signal sequence domain protein n=1 Tax=Streptomyces cinnamoneus TaxID=53446 RepID=A0A2G1XFB3_STRCJ|nr:DUF4429 domain-containing protein [Streptomyces cinnamoneus]PHQ49930.1 Tat pathway signal sequence domain protein [Streptomyces cinnamoneus]PPT13294.1 DUF4429 domain-containing protein [Streptomyces cinnamoneus]